MAWLAYISVGTLVWLSLFNLYMAWKFRRLYATPPEPTTLSGPHPKSAILMGLRGTDPQVHETLRNLMTQTHQNYELHIICESKEDASWQIVHDMIAETGATNVKVQEFVERPGVCAPYTPNAKLVQAAEALDDSVEYIAIAVGSLAPHRNWLVDMTAPMEQDRTIGATFGNRWYMPTEGRLGSLVRYVWNTGAVIPMWSLKIPWGGCFAIRADAVREGNIVHEWSQVAAFDAATPKHLEKQGLTIEFVPPVMMVNRSDCSFGLCVNFVRRQLLWTRLYHKHWPVVVGYGVLMCGLMLVGLVTGLLALATGETQAGLITLGCLLGYVFISVAANLVVESGVRKCIKVRGEKTGWLTPWKLLKLLIANPLAQFVQLLCILLVTFIKRVEWRGVLLEVHSKDDIRIISIDEPKKQPSAPLPEETPEPELIEEKTAAGTS